jgi:hypothetical protein
MESHFVVWVIEARGPRKRIFAPGLDWGAFYTRFAAKPKLQELRHRCFPQMEYRAGRAIGMSGVWSRRRLRPLKHIRTQ